MCSNMDPMACMVNATSDQSEQWTLVPMDVDNSYQEEPKPECLLVEEKLTHELKVAKQELEINVNKLERLHNDCLRIEHEGKIKVSQLQKEKDELEANCRQICETLESERKERKEQVYKLQSEKIRCQQIIQSRETERTNSKAQINKLQSEKEVLNTRLMKEEKKTSDYYAFIEHQKTDIEKLQRKSDERLERNIEQYTKDRAVLLGEKMQLKHQLFSMKAVLKGKFESLEKQNKSLNSTLDLERKHWEEREHRMHHKYNVETDKLKEALTNAVQEKDDLTIRLSKLASASLTHNNPNIADLSDPNRPTKLAEAFSELYDNEWTDAFENLKENDERITVDRLLTMLQKAYGFSVTLTDEASKHMGGNFTSLTLNYYKGSNVQYMYKGTPHHAEKHNVHTTELRNTSETRLEDISKANSSTEYTENVKSDSDAIGEKKSSLFLEEDSSELKTILKEDTQNHELTAEQGFPCVKSKTDVSNPDTICSQYDQMHSKDTIPFNKDTAIQVGSPKEMDVATVSLDFDMLSPTEKQTINDIRKRILHELKDQIIPMIANAVVSEMNLHACDDSITKYVKACTSICWEMRIHQPPICLEVLEIDDQTQFNTATYRHYTKSGHRFDYVVWPAMYLFKGGALLSKGVAQGH